jgi:chemotaxis response regulator CheB
MTGVAPCDIVVAHDLTRPTRSGPRGLPGRRAGTSPLGDEGNATVTRLVVADDSPPYLELLVLVLGQIPQLEVVGTATDGLEAVRVAIERNADVVLLDVEMPGLDGFAAAEEIRRLRPRTDLFLHTGTFGDDRRRLAEQLNLPLFDKLELERTIDSIARVAVGADVVGAVIGCRPPAAG